MPFNGSGTFTRNHSWTSDQATGVPIQGSLMDDDANDLASGLSNAVTRDGQGYFLADINANANRLKNLVLGTVGAPAIYAQGATTTGIYFPAAGQVAITTGGVQAALFDASQNVTLAGSLTVATVGAGSGAALSLRSNGATNATLDASGNLGIGTPTPAAKLHIGAIGAGAGLKDVLLIGNTSSDTNQYRLLWNHAGAGYLGIGCAAVGGHMIFGQSLDNTGAVQSEWMRLDNSGNLLVGQTAGGIVNSNSASLQPAQGYSTFSHVSGTSSGAAYLQFGYAGSLIGSISQNGTTGVTYNTTSDYRLKQSPTPVQDSGAIIDAGNPVRWIWKQDGSAGIGFLAHEMQALLPGAVTGTKDAVDQDGKPIHQSMEYGNAGIVAVMWAELKSLRARLKAAGIP